MKQQRIYAVRAHDRLLEEDPNMGTIMYSYHGVEGPWYDMISGNLDNIWELFEIIEAKEELDRLRTLCDDNNVEWRINYDD